MKPAELFRLLIPTIIGLLYLGIQSAYMANGLSPNHLKMEQSIKQISEALRNSQKPNSELTALEIKNLSEVTLSYYSSISSSYNKIMQFPKQMLGVIVSIMAFQLLSVLFYIRYCIPDNKRIFHSNIKSLPLGIFLIQTIALVSILKEVNFPLENSHIYYIFACIINSVILYRISKGSYKFAIFFAVLCALGFICSFIEPSKISEVLISGVFVAFSIEMLICTKEYHVHV